MSRLSPQFLDELRTRTTLSTLVGSSVKLQRAGREWRACCPFHHEKSPSFYVNDDKGFYHCFGCSAHGDAIRWLTEARGLAFIDAVKELADAAGMTLPPPDPRAAEREAQAIGLHEVMEAAAAWFVEQLASDAGATARAYLNKRGVSADTARSFGMGYSPDNKGALKTALARFGDAVLIEAGLLISPKDFGEDKAPYDRFRGRLMIPIRDARGRTIAFGGRILGVGEPKYLNSPDTPLFDKGRTLYNLDRASAAARRPSAGSGERLIVVEGYMDVIALAQAGIAEVVAPLGTALTEAQLERMWRIVDVPILCFDGDAAGRKAAVRAAERAMPLLAPGRSLDIALLPVGLDPDDLVRSGGRPAIEAVLAEPVALSDLVWEHEEAAAPLATPEMRAGLKLRLSERVATIADSEVRRHYAEAFRQRFDARFFPPRPPFQPRPAVKRGRNMPRNMQGARFAPPPAPPGSRVKAIGGGGVDGVYARAIMAGLVRHPATIATCSEALSVMVLTDDALDTLRVVMLEAAYAGTVVDPATIDTISQEAGLLPLVADLRRANGLAFSFTRGDAEPQVARRDLALAIEALASRPELDAALQAATDRLAMGDDVDLFHEQVRLHHARAEADRVLAALHVEEE